MALLALIGGEAWGYYDLGDNITLWDGSGNGNGKHGRLEDGEVEKGNLFTQAWDLEGFFQNRNQLTMVGGFDFVNGVKDPNYRFDGGLPSLSSGDIFLAASGTPVYGPGAQPNQGGNAVVENLNGYNYVIDLDFATKKYTVYSIGPDAEVKTSWFKSNSGSNPWIYWAGGASIASGSMTLIGYDANGNPQPLSDKEIGYGLQGSSHFGVSVDLGFLPAGTDFYAHFTSQCGNDNLMGQGNTPVPTPATIFLFGTGILGLVLFPRKRLRGLTGQELKTKRAENVRFPKQT